MQIRILIADDHSLSRKGIQSLLQEDKQFRIIGEATNGQEALEKAKMLLPDLILMDINMPKLSGLDATRQIKEQFPQIKIVMLSVSDDIQDFFEAMKNGAQGYLLKNMDTEYWSDYLVSVVAGEKTIPRPLASRILAEFSEKNSNSDTVDSSVLSAREKDVLLLVSQGFTNKEIGGKIYISESTVKNHIRNMTEKLHLRNRSQLTAFAFRHQIIKPQLSK